MKNKLALWGSLALMVAALAGCGGGSDGAPGATGATGATGPAGPAGTNLTASANAATITAAQWQALTPTIDPASVSVTIASPPVVKFKVTDGKGNPVVGLGSKTQASTATVASLANLNFTLAKLVPGTNGSPSKWVNYVMYRAPTVAEKAGTLAANTSCDSTTSPTWCGTFPAADTQGTLVDNGDGTYQYTFYRDIKQAAAIVNTLLDSADGLTKKADAGDLTYDGSLTHRLGIIITGSQPGTGTNTPNGVQTVNPVPLAFTFNMGFDFVPNGGTPTTSRDIVQKSSCTECHDGKGIGHWSVRSATNGVPAGRTVGRNDPRLCVTCHTDQIKYSFNAGEAPMMADGITFAGPSATDTSTPQKRSKFAILSGRAVGNYPNLIHKMHMGDELTLQGYHFNFADEGLFNEKAFPQDPRNCIKCHTGTAGDSNATKDGDNWMKVPSRLACGACHDGINFATGKGTTAAGATTGHVGAAQADDSLCVLCHTPAAIQVYHRTQVPSTHNPIVKDGVATFAYKISSVTINSSNQLVVKFQILMNGTAVKFNTYAAGAAMITGFTGGPTFKVIYATGQDGIAAPSDWNSGHDSINLTDLWAGANGNVLSAPDANNTYTATLVTSTAGRNPSHSMAIPVDAKMVTAVLSDSFSQTGLADPVFGAAVPGVPAMMAASGNTPDGTANVARRVIFSESKCNSCHDRLGTKPYFHSGNYSIAMCAICHTPNQGGSTGWSASFRVWVHGIHSAEKRSVPFTWHAVSKTDNYSNLQYPGVLKDCEQCHLPGTYDFSASQYTPALIAGMLNVQAGTGKLNPASTTAYVFPQAAPVGSGQWAYGLKVDNATDYGTGWSIDITTPGNIGRLVAKTTQDNNLVTSPIAAVCATCHDTSTATSHMEANGGSFYDPRGIAVTRTEQCLICHASGKVADIKAVHMQ